MTYCETSISRSAVIHLYNGTQEITQKWLFYTRDGYSQVPGTSVRSRQSPWGTKTMADDTNKYNLLALTAQLVSSHVAKNHVTSDALPDIIRSVHQTLAGLGQAAAELVKAEPAVAVKKSISVDRVICLDCGRKMIAIKRHLRAEHGMTPDQYRTKWGLLASYPMVAPEYAARRSRLAGKYGFGRRKAAPLVAVEVTAPAPVWVAPAEPVTVKAPKPMKPAKPAKASKATKAAKATNKVATKSVTTKKAKA